MPASTILHPGIRRDRRRSLAPILTTAGYTVTRTIEPKEAIASAGQHQLAMVDVGTGADADAATGFELCREIRARRRWRRVPILCVGAAPTTWRSGSASSRSAPTTSWPGRSTAARSRPGSRRCCSASSGRRIWRRWSRADGLTLGRPRRSVAVFSPKGGVGTTTIATNIAVVAAQRKADRVVLVDLDAAVRWRRDAPQPDPQARRWPT